MLTGVGNGDGTEGAYAGRVLGTYLHGPALVRNPGLADLLLSWAVGPLPPLDAGTEAWTDPVPRAAPGRRAGGLEPRQLSTPGPGRRPP